MAIDYVCAAVVVSFGGRAEAYRNFQEVRVSMLLTV